LSRREFFSVCFAEREREREREERERERERERKKGFWFVMGERGGRYLKGRKIIILFD
jgi:hypothetical protein